MSASRWQLGFGRARSVAGWYLLSILLLALPTGRRLIAAQFGLEEFRTAAQVRRLTAEEADRGYPIRLRGVLTFIDQRNQNKPYRFFQDDTAGIYFFLDPSIETTPLATGQRVEIEGQTGRGEFAPIVFVNRLQNLGQTSLPTAKLVKVDEFALGQQDSQFVEVSGIVRSVRRDESRLYDVIEVATDIGRLMAYARLPEASVSDELVDCKVRIKGVCFTQFNRRRQLFDFGLLMPRAEDLQIEAPAAGEPFALPTQPIGSLLQYNPQGSLGHRQKVQGTVLLRYGDKLYIQDEREGLCIQTRQLNEVQPGDRIEVVGFAEKGGYTPLLRDAIYRCVSAGPVPVPDRISADEALKGDHDCRLVAIEATLLDRAEHSRESFLVLQAGGFIFHAYLQGGGKELSHLMNRSKVRVTGVCAIEIGEEWHVGDDWRAQSFRLLLRSPADILVMQTPPWWTLPRLLWALGLLCAIVLGAFGWVAFLRRRVSQQTGIIQEKLQAEAALRERYVELFENANDVAFTHDLQGRLTSINKAGERLLQFTREKFLCSNLLDLIAEEQRSAAMVWLEQVIKGGEIPAAEWDFVTAAGQRLKLEISARLIEQLGKPLEVEGIGRDITERKRLEREILEISNKEQQRIGHDLHDGVCQQLAAIAYRTHILARHLQAKGAPESADAENIGDLINESLVQTRGVAHGLFPVRLEENGLISALEELAASLGNLYKVRCAFSCVSPAPAVDNSVALHLYYIAQEALLNAAKHSHPSTVSIRLEKNHERWVLSVQDDGCGFESAGNGRVGMGIGIMRYRAGVIGATLELTSRPGYGTTVRCDFTPELRQSPAGDGGTGAPHPQDVPAL